ncbi:MAG: hypothetical protein ABI456_10500 [Ktedonobacteraceae bacterium]
METRNGPHSVRVRLQGPPPPGRPREVRVDAPLLALPAGEQEEPKPGL